MIKINTKNIKNWDFILYCHKKYFEKYIKVELEKYIKSIERNNTNENIRENISIITNFINNNLRSDKNLEELAVGDINILRNYVDKYINTIDSVDEKNKENFKKNFDKVLKKIFDYKKFCVNKNNIEIIDYEKNIYNIKRIKKKFSWNRHKLISLMNIRTCPYCNRQYITNYDNNKTTADLDHFITQKKCPLVALSLYNFVPSCQICNSRFKRDKFEEKNHIYPYEEEFGDECKFYIESSSLDYLWGKKDSFKIKLLNNSQKNKDKIENSIKTFKLLEVYEAHKDYVLEIIQKSIIYNEDMIKSLFIQYPDMFNDYYDVWKCVMGNYLKYDDLMSRPLAKLTKGYC